MDRFIIVTRFPRPPEFCDIVPLTCDNQAVQEGMAQGLALRRSISAEMLSEPGPDEETLREILTIGARVPDHRRVVPFRFIVFTGEARARAGNILSKTYKKNHPDKDEKEINREYNRFLRAPVVIGVVAALKPEHKTPEWEQVLTCGAVCQNILLASNASGYSAQWLSEWYAYDHEIFDAFGLANNEKIAGFIYIGTATELAKERPRPEMASLISYFADNDAR